MPTYSSTGSIRTAPCLFSHMSRKDTHKNSSPSKPNMAALAYAGVETRQPSRLFPFPDSSANADINITSYRNRGASARQVRTAEAGGIWVKSPESDQAECVGYSSFLFRFYFHIKCPYSTVFSFYKPSHIQT